MDRSSFRYAALLLAASVSIGFTTHTLKAQGGSLSARDAVGLIASQFGQQATEWIAEMRAQGGVPQPNNWQVLSYDQSAPRLLYQFWAGGGRAGDGGADNQRYPEDIPVGYFSPSQVSVDSVAAFTIAEGEARRAKMAFDSCDYLLRIREYSNEPIWRLELLDPSRRLVGKLYISASNGEVLRTVWVYRDQRARPDGQPLIVDSFAPGGRSLLQNVAGGGAVLPAPPAQVAPSLTPSVPGRVPGTMEGIHSVPLPPAPGIAVADQGANGSGNPSMNSVTEDAIPAPPPSSTAPAPVPPAPQQVPTPPTPKPPAASSSSGGSGAPVLKPSAGDSGRIPPPPIP